MAVPRLSFRFCNGRLPHGTQDGSEATVLNLVQLGFVGLGCCASGGGRILNHGPHCSCVACL